MAWSAELKAKMLDYAKRKRGTLLKDVPPMALPIFALDDFDERGMSEDGDVDFINKRSRSIGLHTVKQRRQWAYLSRASAEQIAALAEHLPHHTVIIGSRIGPRPVTVFNYARLKHALEQTVSDWRKYLRWLTIPIENCLPA